MINVTVIAVGKLKEGYLRDGCAEYIKRLPWSVLARKVSRSQLLVTLHLPLPVIITFLAGRGFLSKTVTSLPLFAAAYAAISPAAPPPITAIFFFILFTLENFCYL